VGSGAVFQVMERGRVAQRLAIPERGCDLGVLADEGAVIAPRLPCGDFGVDDRAPGDVQPVLHACGEQVRANFFSGSHAWAARGNRAFAGFAVFGRMRILDSKDLANCMVHIEAPLYRF
jgi:hypothetical protein